MKKWMRRIRGAIGMGLTWMVAWLPVGALYGLLVGVPSGASFGALGAAFAGAKFFGALGFVAGGFFSSVLRITEGRSRFDQLTASRFVAWGAVGGAMFGTFAVLMGAGGPGLVIEDAIVLAVCTILGSASAAGTLAVARGGEDRAWLAANEEVGGVGLSEQERSDLLSPTS